MKIVLVCLVLLLVCIQATPNCGVGSIVVGNDCLCGAFTQYTPAANLGDVVCVDGNNSCAKVQTAPVSGQLTDFLRSSVRSIGFEGADLVIHVEYKPVPNSYTDVGLITKGTNPDDVYSGKIEALAWLAQSLANPSSTESWVQYLDDSESQCVQVAAVKVAWTSIAPRTAADASGGLFEFDIITGTVVEKTPNVIVVRDSVVSALDISSIPVTINFNYTVNTTGFATTNFTLAFEVNVTYHLVSASIDPLSLNFTVVVQSNVSYPLSLSSGDLQVTLNGAQQAGFANFDTYTDCPLQWRDDCVMLTTVTGFLNASLNCTDNDVPLKLKKKVCKSLF